MGKLSGKVAVITGGTTGIGFATAKLFHDEGAHVIVTGRNSQSIAEAQRLLPSGITVLQSDAANVAEIEQLVTEIKRLHGKIDVLFLNAGIFSMKPFELTTEEDYDHMLAINLKGPFFMIQKSLPLLANGASVIMTSSIAGHRGGGMIADYAIAKAGIQSLGRSLSVHLADRGIRVNTISPGFVMTPIIGKTGLPQDALDGLLTHATNTTPMHRIARSEEIAKTVLFLASDDSSYQTGSDLVVDGGYLVA